MQTALATGTTMGGLLIEAVLGQGASGIVYRARDAAGQRRRAEGARSRAGGRRPLPRGASCARRRWRPSSSTRTWCRARDGRGRAASCSSPWPTSTAPTCARCIRAGGPLEPDRALGLLDGIADALDAAHAIGLVHRDVTPGNVLVGTADGRETAYLGDFGLARHASTPTSLTGERSFVGTIDYIAPEQIRGDPLDGRADQYSLACVLYACLTGARRSRATPTSRPSSPTSTSVRRRVVALGAGPAARRSTRVLARGLAKEPADRYARLPGAGRGHPRRGAGTPARRRSPARRRDRCGSQRSPCWRVAPRRCAAAARRPPARDDAARDRRRTPSPRRPHRQPAALPLDADAVAFVDPAGRRVLGQSPLAGVADLLVGAGGVWALRRPGVAARPARPPGRPGERRSTCRSRPAAWRRLAHDRVGGGGRRAGPGAPRCGGQRRVTAPLAVTERAGEGTAHRGRRRIAVARPAARGAAVDPDRGASSPASRRRSRADLLAAGDDALWVASSADGRLFEIDAAANRIVARPKLHGFVTDLAVGGGSAWVTVTPEDRVYRLNPDDGSVQGVVRGRARPGERRVRRRRR